MDREEIIRKSEEFDRKFAGTPYLWLAEARCPKCGTKLLIKPINLKEDGTLEILILEGDEEVESPVTEGV